MTVTTIILLVIVLIVIIYLAFLLISSLKEYIILRRSRRALIESDLRTLLNIDWNKGEIETPKAPITTELIQDDSDHSDFMIKLEIRDQVYIVTIQVMTWCEFSTPTSSKVVTDELISSLSHKIQNIIYKQLRDEPVDHEADIGSELMRILTRVEPQYVQEITKDFQKEDIKLKDIRITKAKLGI